MRSPIPSPNRFAKRFAKRFAALGRVRKTGARHGGHAVLVANCRNPSIRGTLESAASDRMTGTGPARIEADYLLETAYPLEAAAEAIAGEQSSGTFVPVPGETPELKARAAARVE